MSGHSFWLGDHGWTKEGLYSAYGEALKTVDELKAKLNEMTEQEKLQRRVNAASLGLIERHYWVQGNQEIGNVLMKNETEADAYIGRALEVRKLEAADPVQAILEAWEWVRGEAE